MKHNQNKISALKPRYGERDHKKLAKRGDKGCLNVIVLFICSTARVEVNKMEGYAQKSSNFLILSALWEYPYGSHVVIAPPMSDNRRLSFSQA
ncbi:hypothetical protein [Erwinia typographi]|uniref:hypothetical protein n=1 Tax=Erwinia typographi TaxID=371042 RepID=UPI0012EDCF40|nr:hypothetical protein [Erwinia typographi]